MVTERELRRRTRYWQGVLGLTHWRIDVDLVDTFTSSTAPGNALANCSPMDSYRSANIEFKRDTLEDEIDTFGELILDEKIVHELLHVMFRDYDQAARAVGPLMGVAWDGFSRRLLHEEEKLVEELARIIVKTGTLPE